MRLIAFRSFEDGTVAGAGKGFVDSARRYAPDLIADAEDATDLPVFHAFLPSIAGLSENAAFWERLDKAIEQRVFVPGKNLLFLDNSWEGEDFNPETMGRTHRLMGERQIPLDTVAVMTLCRNLPALYDTWADKQNIKQRLTLYGYWGGAFAPALNIGQTYGNELSFQGRVEEVSQQLYGMVPHEYRFLCLNNIRRPSRLSMALLLEERFGAQTLLSFGKIEPAEVPQFVESLKPWVTEGKSSLSSRVAALASNGKGSLASRVAAFAAKTPLIVDVETGSVALRERAEYTITMDLYRRTAMSVVTETNMSSRGQLAVTEKTIKPLGLFHPFILAGNRHALRTLHGEGFRTFQPFVNESYDDIADGPERLRAVQREVMRIGALSRDEFTRGLRSIAENVIHNALQLRYMQAHREWSRINDVLQRVRRDFGPRLGFSEPKVMVKTNTAWSEVDPILIEDFAEIRLDTASARLQVTPGRDFDYSADVYLFVHTHFGEGHSPPMVAQNHRWPGGKGGLVIDLPKGDIRHLFMGQFTIRDGHDQKIWQTTIEAPVEKAADTASA